MPTKNEYKWIIKVSIIILLLTTIPYFIGFMRQGESWYFTGFVFGVEDGNSYIAKMNSGASGDWLFKTPYSAYQQKGVLAFLPYLLLGKISSMPGQHEQLIALFHGFRWFAGLLMIFATYQFISIFIEDVKFRRIGTFLSTVGGGLGWVSIIGFKHLWQNRIPLEFYSPESFGFLSLYGLPHLALARALLLLGLIKYINNDKEYILQAVIGGVVWLILGLFQPIYIVVGWVVIIVHTIIEYFPFLLKKQHLRQNERNQHYLPKMFIMISISSPFVIYTLFSFLSDQYLSGWVAQNIISSPPMFDFILAYGIFLPFTFISSIRIFNLNISKYKLLVGWLTISPVLAYAPVYVQRRLLEAIWIVIIILFLNYFIGFGKKNSWYLLVIISSSLINPVIIICGGIISIWNPSTPLYRHIDEIRAIKFLSDISSPYDVILSGYESSNVIPAWVPLRTLIGHGPESVNLEELSSAVNNYYKLEGNDEERNKLIEEFNIKYVFFGPLEKNIGNYLEITTQDDISLIYKQSGYSIYETIDREKRFE